MGGATAEGLSLGLGSGLSLGAARKPGPAHEASVVAAIIPAMASPLRMAPSRAVRDCARDGGRPLVPASWLPRFIALPSFVPSVGGTADGRHSASLFCCHTEAMRSRGVGGLLGADKYGGARQHAYLIPAGPVFRVA
jgi:hypothetical protein